jgi:outer membrane protein assembly factor BamB
MKKRKNDKKMAKRLIILILVLIYSPLRGDWNTYQKSPAHNPCLKNDFPMPRGIEWKVKLSSGILASPSVQDGILYVGTLTGELAAIKTLTGKVIWKFQTKGGIISSPAVDQEKIYFSSKDGYFYALRKHGQLAWKFQTGGSNCSSPALGQDRVYFGSGYPSNRFFCLRASDGKLIWRRLTSQPIYSSPALTDEEVITGSNNGYFTAYELCGREKWKFKTGSGIHFSSASVSGDRVYFAPGHFDKNLYVLSRQNGEEIARINLTKSWAILTSPLSIDGETVYVAFSEWQKVFIARVDIKEKKVVWKKSLGKRTSCNFISGPVVTPQYIFIGSPEKGLCVLEKERGEIIKEFLTEGTPAVTPVVSDNKIYVVTTKGWVYAFSESASDVTEKLPKVTKVFQNFPSPFQSYTYIPYQLSEDTTVSVEIYNLQGQCVRKLKLGKKKAGFYKKFSKAIYWDGRDDAGKRLPPGTYFYKFQAGDIKIVKKTVITR